MSAIFDLIWSCFIGLLMILTSLFNGSISNPFYRRPSAEVEKEFLYQRDNWHHHYTENPDGSWSIQYLEVCPNKSTK